VQAEAIEGFRLAPQQRRLLALAGARGGLGQAAGAAVRLRGRLDAAALRSALAAVVDGAEVLRTRLMREPRSGAQLQVIGTGAPEWAADEDWSGFASAEVDARLAAWGGEVLALAADPSQPPLVSASLVRLADHDHVLRLVVPAALADSETMGLLASRIASAYAAAVGGDDAAEEGIQFVDVSEWQNEFLDSDDAAEGRRYWKQRIAAARAAVRLPHERQNSGDTGPSAPRLVRLSASADLVAQLEASAASLGITADALAMAGWVALLHRLNGQADVRFAAAFPGRSFDEVKDALGPFARHLPLECAVPDGIPAATLARALAAACGDANAQVDAFSADGVPAGEPVSAFGFAWNALPETIRAGGIEWSVTDLVASPEPFRAALLITSGASPAVHLQYDPGALSEDAANRLAEQAATVLEAVAVDPSVAADALPVMGERERAEVLGVLATSGELDGEDERVDVRIAAQALKTPERTALRSGIKTLSYAELSARVERLAGHLHGLGVRPETRVAILLDRTADAVVAMLATLRAGGAYVPLDAAYPTERVAFMLRDSGAAVLMTDAARAHLADGSDCRVVRIDADAKQVAASADAPASAVHPANAAYVIYTSGTTGRPKGTVIEHRALARYVRAATAALDLRERVGYAVVSTLAADLGATMLYPALCLGGTLHLVSEQVATDPAAWAEYAEKHGVHCLKVVPSHLRLLLDAPDAAAALPRLRLVLGGEACDAALIDRVRAARPGLRIFNHYGPTETTVGVVAGELRAEDAGAPPLGRPLPGARIYLLDARGLPVPAGVTGEVHVGGGSLARGYLDRPALTAEKFVPDAFSAQPGARLYRTGDLARWRADGRLEFLGRADGQVKVNGHRVEPGEVEAALAAHPSVSAARVVPNVEDGSTRLIAYVVPASGQRADAAELRRHLRERLPEPFVPAAFVSIPRMPLTPNGKLDVRALPSPSSASEDAAPRDRSPLRIPAEHALAEVWREILNVPDVGAMDDFFELGGNSFLAVRLMSRIQKQFGKRLPLAALIGAGTVRGIAAMIDHANVPATPPAHLVALREGGDAAPLFCVHPGEGTVLCYRGMVREMAPGRPVYGLQALDFEMGRAPLVRIEEMAARYVTALRARQPEGPYLLAGWSYGGLVAFEMARQLAGAGQEVARLFLFDCRLPVTTPALSRLDPVLFRASMLFHGSVLVDADGNPTVTAAELAPLDALAQVALIAARAGTTPQALMPAHIPADQIDRYLDLRMARSQGVREYVMRPATVPITLFRADEVDLDTPFAEMRAAYEQAAATRDYGWGELSPEPVEVIDVRGTHHTIFAAENLPGLAAELDRALADADALETAPAR
jgi:amino acid adenylation domain-containing protein